MTTDAERIDWLSRQSVIVRKPLRYGVSTFSQIVGHPDIEDETWDLRSAIDAEMARRAVDEDAFAEKYVTRLAYDSVRQDERRALIELALARIRGTLVVDGESAETLIEAIAGRVADLAKPTA